MQAKDVGHAGDEANARFGPPSNTGTGSFRYRTRAERTAVHAKMASADIDRS